MGQLLKTFLVVVPKVEVPTDRAIFNIPMSLLDGHGIPAETAQLHLRGFARRYDFHGRMRWDIKVYSELIQCMIGGSWDDGLQDFVMHSIYNIAWAIIFLTAEDYEYLAPACRRQDIEVVRIESNQPFVLS